MAINDNFVLEISAQIKKDTQKIVQDLRNTIKNIEKESEINLEVKDEKVKQYIEKLKASLNEINAAMKDSNIEANSTSFVRFVDVLRDGAKYSEQIADNLNLASNVAKNLDRLEEFAKSKNKTDDELKAEKLRKDNDTNLKNQIKAKKEIQKLYSDMANDMDKKSNSSEVMKSRQQQISEQYKKLKELEKEQSIIIQKYKEINSSEKLATLDDLKNTKEYESFDKAKNKAGLDLAKRNAKLDEKYSKYSEFNKNEELYNKNENSTYRKNADIYRTTLDEYKAKINEIKNSNVTNFDTSELTEYENKLKGILKILNNDDFKNPKITLLDDGTDFNKAYSEMEKLLNGEGKLIKESLKINDTAADNGIVKMTGSFRTADKQIKDVTYTFNELTGAITRTKEASKSADITSKFDTFGDKLNKKFGDLTTYLLSFASFYEVVDVVKQGFSIIKDLDTQLTEMQKVSNESLSNLQQYANNSFDIAEKIGTTGSQLQSSTADYMRLGKSLQDATKLAQDTNILMNVSEFDSIDQATESMISMTQAYQELDSMDIIDKLNLTGNNYSISTNELAQSLQKSSSALKTAKNDFDEAIALTVAGNSVVQDPDSVAAGIRTIALRMTGTDAAKKELEDLGEETDNVLTRSKLNDTLEMLTDIDERGGISLLDDNGNYRSITKTLIELAERWKEIGEQDVKDGQNRQNALLEALAGKNRSNILASILNDPNLLKNVYNDVSTNYQGSAWKENEKQMQSIEGHLKQLKNTWEEFWASDKNREFVNDIIDLANAFLELLNSIGGAKTALAGLFGLFVKFNDKANGIFTGLFSGLKNIVSEIAKTGDSKTIKSFLGDRINNDKLKGFKNILSSFGNKNNTTLTSTKDILKQELAKETLSDLLFGNKNKEIDIDEKELTDIALGKKMANVISDDIEENMDNVKDITKNAVSNSVEGGIEGASKNIVSNAGKLKTAFSNIITFLFTTPIGGAITATAAVAGTAMLIKSYKKNLEKAAEDVQNEVINHREEKTNLDEFKNTIPEIAKEYDNLKQGVSSTGENISLTTDEFERFNEISNQIANIFPNLISGYSSAGVAILDMTDSVSQLNEEYDKLSQNQAKQSLENTPYKKSKKSIENTNWNLKKASNSLMDDLEFNSVSMGANNNVVEFAGTTKKLRENLKGKVNDKTLENINFDYYQKTNDRFTTQHRKAFQSGLSGLVKDLSFDDDEYKQVLNELELQVKQSKNEKDKKKNEAFYNFVKGQVSNYKETVNNVKEQMKIVAQSQNSYYDMENENRVIFDKIISNLNKNDFDKYSGSEEDIKKILNNFVEYSNDNSGTINRLNNYKELYTGKDKIADVKNKINNYVNSVSKGTGLSKDTIENAFQIDDSVFKQSENKILSFYDKISKKTTGFSISSQDAIENQRKELEKNFDATQLNKIGDNINSASEDIINDYNTKFKNYYNDFNEYFLDVLNSIQNSEKSYIGENKSFAQLESNVSNYSSTLAQLNTLGNDNVNINTDLADSLLSMGDGFSEYVEKSEDGTTATIKNIEAVKELIKNKQQEGVMDARNSKNEAIQSYQETTDTLVNLTDQLERTADSEGHLDESILKNIQSTQSQINTIKRNIEYYEQLETKILGATNAFDEYSLAVQQDESQNTFSNASSMLDTLKSGFETSMMGTASFDAALQGLLSDSKYNEIMNTEDIDNRVQKMKSSYNELKSYFKKDSNGNPALSGVENFVNKGYSKGLFDSKNIENFDITDNTSIDDFVDKMNLSKEAVYSMFETIEKFNIDKDNSIFDKLMGNSDGFTKTNYEIKQTTNELEKQVKVKNDLLAQRSKIDKAKEPEKWQKLTDKIHKCSKAIDTQQSKQKKLNNENINNVEEYIKIQDEIKDVQIKTDLYRKKLEKLKNDKKKGKNVSDEEISEVKLKSDEAEQKLDSLIKRKNELGKPVKVDLELTKEKLESEIDKLQKKKVKIEAEVTTGFFTGSTPTTPADKINALYNNTKYKEINKKLKEKQATLQQINIMLGIDAQTTGEYDKAVAKIKADKKKLGKDVDFEVKAKGTNTVISQLSGIKNYNIPDKDITTTHTIIENKITQENGKTTNTKIKKKGSKPTKSLKEILNEKKNKYTNPAGAFGQNNSKSVFNYFGNAFANGNLNNMSSYTSGKTLVGELGAETLVDPYAGTYRVVGIHGAEFVNIPKDAIVFNHQQTKELQQSGKIKSRGAIVSNASGFMQGFAKVSPYGNAYAKIYNNRKKPNSSKKSSSKKSSKSKSKSNSSSKETKGLIDDIFDWIEIRLERLSNKTQRYITLAENAISKTVKELGYKYAISTTKTEITNNQAGYKKYMSYANALIKKSGVKNASKYAKKVRDGSIDLQKITDEKTLDFVNSYQQMYEKAKECDSAVLSLTAQLSDLAESLYNLPTEYAEKKIEKFSDEMDVLSAKLDIYNTYQNKNKTLDQQISLQKNIYNANQSAYKNTYSNLKSAKSKINSTKDSALKGLASKQKKSIVASVNANKEIHISPKYSATLQSAIANYNKALEANRIASNNAKKASAEYTKVLRENTNAKYENIKSYYDTRRSWDDARLSAKDAKLEYRTSMGYSNTSETQKQVLKDKLSYEQDKYNKLLEEKSKFNRATLDKQFKEGKLSREDYYSQISHIEELDENIYTTATSINNLNKEIKNLKITHLDYVIDGIKNTLEKFKNYISLKEVRGDKATETDYTDQIKYEENQIDILYNKYKELEEEKASYAVESEEYKRVTEEQASIASEALQARQNIDEIRKSVNSIRFKPLEDANASLERQIDDYEHLKDILSKDELIDDNGNFTDSGLANMALIGKQMEASKKLIVNYRTGLEKLTESYKNGNLTLDEYNEQSREYIKSIQDAVSAVDNYKSALIDMYKQQLEAENDTLQKTIDKRKEALQAKKGCVKMPVFI